MLHANPYVANETPGDVLQKTGEAHFENYCASCHGLGATGDGPAAEALKSRPADLTQIRMRRNGEFPLAELAAIIDGRASFAAHGSREMPVWGDTFRGDTKNEALADEITLGRVVAILQYLRSIQKTSEQD